MKCVLSDQQRSQNDEENVEKDSKIGETDENGCSILHFSTLYPNRDRFALQLVSRAERLEILAGAAALRRLRLWWETGNRLWSERETGNRLWSAPAPRGPSAGCPKGPPSASEITSRHPRLAHKSRLAWRRTFACSNGSSL